MHLNPYGEYAILLAADLANDWPPDRAGIVARTRDHGMTMRFPTGPDDHLRTRAVIDDWLTVVDAVDPHRRAILLNAQMAAVAAYPRLTDHDGEGWHLHYRDDDCPLPEVLAAVISVGTALHLTTRGMHRLGRCAAGREPADTGWDPPISRGTGASDPGSGESGAGESGSGDAGAGTVRADDRCPRVVVDVTRNGRQRYCSVRCANRSAVRRHRSRSCGAPPPSAGRPIR